MTLAFTGHVCERLLRVMIARVMSGCRRNADGDRQGLRQGRQITTTVDSECTSTRRAELLLGQRVSFPCGGLGSDPEDHCQRPNRQNRGRRG